MGYLCDSDCYDCKDGTCTPITEDDDGTCSDDCNSCLDGVCTLRQAGDDTECQEGYFCDGQNTTCQARGIISRIINTGLQAIETVTETITETVKRIRENPTV